MNGINEINIKLLFYNLMALCFVFPIAPKLVPFFLVIISIVSLFNFKTELNKQFNYYKPFILSISFYLISILGLLWSSDITSGIKHLEIKLSFLIIPLIFLNKNLISQLKIKYLFYSFLIGNCFAAIFALGNAALIYFQKGINHFTYTLLSPNFHPTYLSMYALFCLSLLLLSGNMLIKNKYLKNVLIVFLILWTILLSSKINIAILFIVLTFQLIHNLKASQNKLKYLIISLLSLFCVAAFLYFNTSITERFKAGFTAISPSNNIVNSETESNVARILIWKSASNLVIQHPLIGVGTGDVNNELVKEYENRSYSGIKEKRLNAHNQYLQTALSTGIPSALLLLLFLIFPMLAFSSPKYRILHYFIVIFCVNGLVESTLENQAGVVFFMFFYFLLLRYTSNKIELNTIFK